LPPTNANFDQLHPSITITEAKILFIITIVTGLRPVTTRMLLVLNNKVLIVLILHKNAAGHFACSQIDKHVSNVNIKTAINRQLSQFSDC